MKRRISTTTTGGLPSIMLIAAGILIQFSPSLRAAALDKKIADSDITFAIEDGLVLENGVFPNDVDVNTDQGIVTLSGSVNNLLAQERALKIAESMRGVRGVINRTKVISASRPDEDIRKDIAAALSQDPATQSYKVGVSVNNSVATLTGSVGSFLEKQLAGRIAKGIKGAKEIVNKVIINYSAKRSDEEIAADVKARLQWDIWINGDMVSSAVQNGKVTLTGSVGSAITRSRAYDDAWVNGVTSVDNSGMTIDPWARDDTRKKAKYAGVPDGDIKKAVLAELRRDPRISAFSPDVSVEGGVAILGGDVGNLKAKNAAKQDAKNVVGVVLVDNFLKVRPTERLTDAQMKSQLTAALFWDPLLEGFSVNATVTNRVAYLSGEVGSNFQKAEAQDVASRTKGVAVVRNRLKIEPEISITYYDLPDYAAYDSPVPFFTDEQIKKNIENGLFWSPYVDKDDIVVAVDGGVATLTGSVGTWVGWGEVDKDAYTSGATVVKNQVKVKNGAWWW